MELAKKARDYGINFVIVNKDGMELFVIFQMSRLMLMIMINFLTHLNSEKRK